MQDPQLTSNREGYDLWSGDYDNYPNPTVAIDDRHFPRLWSGLRGRQVLEVGCGTGRHTVRLWEQGNVVVGLDLSPGMLARARLKFPAGRPVTLLEADFFSASALDGRRFDALIAALVLEHFPSPAAFFIRAAGLLAKGADVYVSEIHPQRSAQGALAHFKTADGTEVHLSSTAHREGEIETAAAAAGFVLVGTSDAFGDEELARLRPKWIRYLGRPMVRMWHWRLA